jgi:hypothetical protein
MGSKLPGLAPQPLALRGTSSERVDQSPGRRTVAIAGWSGHAAIVPPKLGNAGCGSWRVSYPIPAALRWRSYSESATWRTKWR